MITRITAKSVAVLTLLLMALIYGCGTDYTHNAPSDATITFAPTDGITASIIADTQYPVSITVKDSQGAPLNGIKVVISGSFARPRVPERYHFFDTRGDQNSGFVGTTNEGGVYNFTLYVPGFVSGTTTTNVFTDNIEARSGAVYGTMKISINE